MIATAIAAILAATSAPADTVPARIPVARPGPKITAKPVIVKMRQNKVVQLSRVPASALRIKDWPGVTIARAAPAPPGGISSAGATIYVSKSWVEARKPNSSQQCYGPAGGHSDWLDLSEPRRHGFRLAALDLQPLASPGYASEGPSRRGNAYFDAEQKPVAEIGQTVKLALVVPILAKPSGPHVPVIFCFTGYRANLSLYGPAGIDPFTGRSITPAQVN